MRRELLLLDEIIMASVRAMDIAAGRTAEELDQDPNARDALLWNLTVIGEAAAQLPESLRNEHREIPWQHPVRMRNRLVHGYWSIDLEIVHTVATEDLTVFVELVREVRRTVAAADAEDGSSASSQ